MSWIEENLPHNLQVFIAYLEVEKGYSLATLRAYATDLKEFELFLNKVKKSLDSPEKIVKPDVLSFIQELYAKNLSKSSLARKLSSLRSFFAFF